MEVELLFGTSLLEVVFLELTLLSALSAGLPRGCLNPWDDLTLSPLDLWSAVTLFLAEVTTAS